MRSFVRYWLPVLAWVAVILAASSDLFAARETGGQLHALLLLILGHDLSPEQFAALHFAIRKGAHLTEYGILGGLSVRALRLGGPWSWRRAAGAVAIAAVVAIVDEAHQALLPSRTGSPIDVGIDIVGATIAAALARLVR